MRTYTFSFESASLLEVSTPCSRVLVRATHRLHTSGFANTTLRPGPQIRDFVPLTLRGCWKPRCHNYGAKEGFILQSYAQNWNCNMYGTDIFCFGDQMTHCHTARLDPRIRSQITGSWSMDNNIIARIRAPSHILFHRNVTADGSLCLELPIFYDV